jgi:hypothetical protein
MGSEDKREEEKENNCNYFQKETQVFNRAYLANILVTMMKSENKNQERKKKKKEDHEGLLLATRCLNCT